MSRDFIGSKISIITKSQCRYTGTIIGIDAQSSSIILGSVKCFGIENRSGHLTNGHMPGTTLPIMQFANSDIEDLKIVEDEQASEPSTHQQQQPSFSMPVVSPPSTQQTSIHDDPAIVSAVVSSTNKENSSVSNRLIHNLQHMTLSDEKSKNEGSRIRSDSGELGPSWSLISSSKWEQSQNNNNNFKSSSQYPSGNKSKFFDDFMLDKTTTNNNNQHQSNRSYQRSSNTHSTQTSRENNGQYDDNGLPIRQPFFSNDRSYPQQQQQQQQQPQQHRQNRYQNGHNQHQQRYFYNNRRPNMPTQNYQQQRRPGGNRETFQDNPNDYDADFDFETSNLKFNKLTTEDDLTADQPSFQPQIEHDLLNEYSTIYDKKKSFFDSLPITEPSDGLTLHKYNRSKNQDTFGFDNYQHQNNRSNGNNGYRRPNNRYRQQQQYGNNDNNGYHYRY